MRPTVICLALSVLLSTLATAPAPALAGDDGETIEQSNDTIKAILKARKSRDEDLMADSFVRLVELHNGLEGDGMRAKLQATLGGVLKDKKCKAFHDSVVTTLEQLDDGDGVLKQLKPVLPKATTEKATELGIYAVTVVGTVMSRKGIRVLAGLAAKAKDLAVRVAAIKGLGAYRTMEKQRVKVFGHLITLLMSVRPTAEKPLDKTSALVWAAVEKPLVMAMDELTFKDLETSAAWATWHDKHKPKWKAAFAD